MLNLKQIGDKICLCRRNAGLTQDDLAETLHLSRQAISRWEQGLAAPSIDNLIELSRLFHTSLEEILCLDEPAFINPDDIFQGYDRKYIISRLCENSLPVYLPDIFYQLSPVERMTVLTHYKRVGRPIPHDLYVKLTFAEQRMIKSGGWIL